MSRAAEPPKAGALVLSSSAWMLPGKAPQRTDQWKLGDRLLISWPRTWAFELSK